MAKREISASTAKELILSGKSLGGAIVNETLDLSGNKKLKKLPKGMVVYELNVSETSLASLPQDIEVECGIHLRDCHSLTSLPANIKTGTLDLRNCKSLTALPEGLNVWFLDVQGCDALSELP